jgi:hypothetical protein
LKQRWRVKLGPSYSSLVVAADRVFVTETEAKSQSDPAAYRTLEDQLPVSDQAVSNKLQHAEPPVSAALVRDSALRIAPVIRARRAPLPALRPGYRVQSLDGNHLAATGHRLQELRRLWAAPLPGIVLAALDQEHRTVTDALLTEDGPAQGRALLEEVYPLVRPGEGGPTATSAPRGCSGPSGAAAPP